MTTTESYGCDRHGEDAYQGCALCDLEALASRLAEAEAENSRLVAANKARDEFLRGHRYKRSEMDQYIDLCESQIADWHRVADERSAEIVRLSARLAEAEGREQMLLNRCDVLEEERNESDARLAEADRNEGTLLGMIRHQRDVLRECLPYLNESMAGRRPGRSADDIRAAVKALITDSASVGQETKDA